MKSCFTFIILFALLFSFISCLSKTNASLLNNKIKSQTSMTRYLKRFIFPVKKSSTKIGDYGKGKTIYLAEHKVDCGIGALSQFKLQRVGPPKLKYDYQCINPMKCDAACIKGIKAKDKKRCKVINTSNSNLSNKFDGNATNYLDRLKVACPVGMVITGFNLLNILSLMFDF